MPPDLLIVGSGPAGQAALRHAQGAGQTADIIEEAALVMVEADGTVLCVRDGGLSASRPAQLLVACEPVPRLLPIPGWTLPGVTTLSDAAPRPGDAVWVAGQGVFLEEAARAFPAAGRIDLAAVSGLRAEGGSHLRGISFLRDGIGEQHPADRLVLHDGTVPAVQITRALGCAHEWDAVRSCWAPQADALGVTSRAGVKIARAETPAIPPVTVVPEDATTVCPCEGVTAGAIRAAGRLDCPGLNQLKAFTRCGMGACQGRLCVAIAAQVLAAARGVPLRDIAPMRVRFPLRPVKLGLLAALDARLL